MSMIDTRATFMDYRQHIEIVPGRRSGRPCIKDSRITVYDVLGWLASGMSSAEILDEYPELSADQIQACLAYAAEREHQRQSAPAA